MSAEKCCCHIVDSLTGESYTVKDKEARERLTQAEKDIESNKKGVEKVSADIKTHTNEIESLTDRVKNSKNVIDTKLTVVKTKSERHKVYAITPGGAQEILDCSSGRSYNTLVLRDENGYFKIFDAKDDLNPVSYKQFNTAITELRNILNGLTDLDEESLSTLSKTVGDLDSYLNGVLNAELSDMSNEIENLKDTVADIHPRWRSTYDHSRPVYGVRFNSPCNWGIDTGSIMWMPLTGLEDRPLCYNGAWVPFECIADSGYSGRAMAYIDSITFNSSGKIISSTVTIRAFSDDMSHLTGTTWTGSIDLSYDMGATIVEWYQ